MPVILSGNKNTEKHNRPELDNAQIDNNFLFIYDLQQRSVNLEKQIDTLSEEYIKNMATLSPEGKRTRKSKMQNLFNKVKECGDEKMKLTTQTEELIDKRIKKLESVTAPGLKTKILNIGKKVSGKKTKETRKREKSESSEDGGNTRNKKNQKQKHPKNTKTNNSNSDDGRDSAISSDEFDIPIDPNEETYCLCHQVAYGGMIGCDNSNCAIEWFHFPCVGITAEPKGKWYCPKCTQNKRKK